MNTLTLTLIVLLVLGLSLLGYAVYSLTLPLPVSTLENNSVNFQKMVSSELPEKCKIPAGYTQEKWVEHLGHHPDRYADCFQYFQ